MTDHDFAGLKKPNSLSGAMICTCISKRSARSRIPVTDVDRAVAFYRDVLGLAFLFRGGPNLAFFDCGGVRILLDKPEEAEFENHSSVIYFTVADIKARSPRWSSGARSRRPSRISSRGLADREVWMGFFRDPDENVLALMSEIPI